MTRSLSSLLLLPLPALVAVVLLEGNALAQSGGEGALPSAATTRIQGHGFVEELASNGSRVIFGDDPMTAEVQGEITPRIVVRSGGARMGLIHLRTHFVAEMLKSVENM